MRGRSRSSIRPRLDQRGAHAAHGLSRNPPLDSLSDVEVVVVATKPQIIGRGAGRGRPLGAMRPLVLSIAAGKTIATFEAAFGEASAVIRSIPTRPQRLVAASRRWPPISM